MKKLTATILILALFLSLTAALAEAPDITPEDLKSIVTDKGPELVFPDTPQRASFPQTEDKVTIENGVFHLESMGIRLSIQMPFGMLTLGQDMRAQIDEYLQFNDGHATAQNLINSGIHTLFYDYVMKKEVWLLIKENKLSAFFPNPDVFDQLLATLQKIAVETQDFSEVEVNGRRFIRLLEVDPDREYLLYYTMHEGKQVILQMRDEKITPEMEQLLRTIAEAIELV